MSNTPVARGVGRGKSKVGTPLPASPQWITLRDVAKLVGVPTRLVRLWSKDRLNGCPMARRVTARTFVMDRAEAETWVASFAAAYPDPPASAAPQAKREGRKVLRGKAAGGKVRGPRA